MTGPRPAAAAPETDTAATPPKDDAAPVAALAGGAAAPVTAADLAAAVRVLAAVAGLERDPRGLERYKDAALRPLRKALAGCLELHRRTMFRGQEEAEFLRLERERRSLKRQRTADKALQKKYIQTTQLRQGRLERLRQLTEDAREEEEAKLRARYLIPDGPVDATTAAAATPLLRAEPEDAVAEAPGADGADGPTAAPPTPPTQLPFHRSCYVCKVRYTELHAFYDQLCPACAALNLAKRHASAAGAGRVAVVTGARVKIGLQVCLKLLRAGCRVVATTRFPNAAADTFRREADFAAFRDRLHVYGLDLRDVTGLEAFTRYLKLRFADGIDILINNACQTVRRPAGYYAPLVQQERELWAAADGTHRAVLGGCVEFERIRRRLHLDHQRQGAVPALEGAPGSRPPSILMEMADADRTAPSTAVTVGGSSVSATTTTTTTTMTATTTESPFETSGLSHSAVMSQTVLLPEDAGVSDAVLPPGVTDINGHQVDLRDSNSWLLKMEEVSTPEIMECMFVNCIAPFVLNSRLKPLMCTPDSDDRPDRYIINVSAMEGKFYRYKMPNHPHTNMAKAALNMLTRTSAEDLATRHRIYMNSVDTGWINDENPLERAKRTEVTNNFQTPIDEIDAAARILDPVFLGIREGKKLYGCFFKDYHESEW